MAINSVDDEPDEYSLWFEVRTVDVNSASSLRMAGSGFDTVVTQPELYKLSSKRGVIIKSDTEFRSLDCRWTVDHEAAHVRRMLRSLRKGCIIELCAFRAGSGETIRGFLVEVELEYAVVRKM